MSKPIDLPREELLQRADATIAEFKKQGIKAVVRFKFTCENCGERCTLVEPNILFEDGECCVCFHMTKITHGGFALEMTIGA